MAIRMAFVVAAVHATLKAQVARINALNVYPVPDGDTGTNMLLTLESVLKEASKKDYATPEEASKAGARAALMGARGNSGVILSQMIRGAAEVLSKKASFTAESFAAALEGARERAYASIREPVEGTMLTVVKDAAHAARNALDKGADLPAVVKAAAQEAHASVKRTPQLLGVLREAGVVDAGGLGVAVILDGIYACITGQKIEAQEQGEDGVPDLETLHAEEEAWGYCTEFLVTDFSGDAEEFEERIHSLGKSVLVVPDADLVKVHVHTQDPGEALSYGGSFGRLAGVKVDDMEAQVQGRSETLNGSRASRADSGGEVKNIGVVAASRGEGSRKLFESMGAVVIEGGQGANPSAADFAQVVEQTGMGTVVLLPNNKNIMPTAEQVEELVEADVYVVPTTSIAAGLATMVGFDAAGEPETVFEEMDEIAASLRLGEITRAVRDARVDGRDVPEGSYIGLLDGRLHVVEESVEAAAVKLAEDIVESGADLLTLLCGADLTEEAARRIEEEVRDLDEELEVEVHQGGQPMYPLQMAAE
ncbi:MAG: DAK2 domain-containing protein [Actinomycetota bacterium]|nr:DAK2 domain-containing protein [Actinomycetota bacterium]